MSLTLTEREISQIFVETDILTLILKLRQGLDPNLRVQNGRPLITLAMSQEMTDEQIHLIELLLEHGADTNIRTPLFDFPYTEEYGDYSLLMYTIENCRHVDVIRMLLENGANPNEIYPNWKDTILTRVVQLYISGVIRSPKIRIPRESRELSYELCLLLIKFGADKDMRNLDGTTAIEKLLQNEKKLMHDPYYKRFLRAVQYGSSSRVI